MAYQRIALNTELMRGGALQTVVGRQTTGRQF